MSLAFLQSHESSDKHTDAVWGIACLPSTPASGMAQERVVSASADGTLRQWDASSGQRFIPLSSAASSSSYSSVPAPSPTTSQLQSQSAPTTFEPPTHPLGIVSLSAAVAHIAGEDGGAGVVPGSVADGGGGAKRALALYNTIEGHTALWDLDGGRAVGHYDSFAREKGVKGGQQEPAWSVSLHPSAETYAATGGTGSVSIHSAAPANFGERIANLDSGRKKFGLYAKHSPDGSRLALSLETGQIFIFDVAQQALSTTYTAHAAPVRQLAWSADGQLLLSASDDRRLTLFDVRQRGGGNATAGGGHSSGAVAALSGHMSWVLSCAFSPDGRLAISGSADKTIKVWDLSTRQAVSTIQDSGEVWSVAWRSQMAASVMSVVPTASSSGAFVSGGEDGVVRWWRSAGSG